MPAVSKKQQKFFGIVRSVQKGEQSPTTPEVAKAASSMKKSDVKKFASTKHKGLPVKKESYYNWRDELVENPIQKAWNWFVPHPKDSANPNVRSGKLQPGKLEAGLLNKMNTTAANINKPIKTTSKTLKTAGGLKKGIDWIGKNPGKTAAIGAGVVGAGMLAKRVLSGKKKKKEVKEEIKTNRKVSFPEMQKRIRDAEERRRNQKKESEKLYIDIKRKGIKFYDKKGTGRIKKGKKIYD